MEEFKMKRNWPTTTVDAEGSLNTARLTRKTMRLLRNKTFTLQC